MKKGTFNFHPLSNTDWKYKRKLGAFMAVWRFKSLINIFLCLTYFSLLAACTGVFQKTDPYHPLVQVKEDQDVKDATFADLKRPNDTSLSLEECIDLCIANNAGYLSDLWNRLVSKAQYDLAVTQYYPSLNSGLDLTIQPIDPFLLSPPSFTDAASLSWSVNFFYTLYSGGRISNDVKAKQLLYKSRDFQLQRAVDGLIFSVYSFYYSILGQDYVIKALEFAIASLKKQLELVKLKKEAAKAAKLNVLRIEVRIAEVEQQLLQAQNQYETLLKQLITLMGLIKEEKNYQVEGSIDGDVLQMLDASVDKSQLISWAIENRGDYLSFKAQIESQAYSIDAIKGNYYPNITLSAVYSGSYAFDNTLDNTIRVGLSIDFSLYDGGRTSIRVKEGLLTLSSMLERLRDLEESIILNIETSLLSIKSNLNRIKLSKIIIEQAEESLEIEKAKYQEGKGTTTDLLLAEETLLDAKANYYQALVSYYIALAKLYYDTGRRP